VRLLNGLLIAPDETFSLLNALKPFETENGYLPELVIKGDKIQPEIGGGLCQIGTTTFRAAMNSGLPIVSRSNHSLVVSYYNDPANGNPGTDATIYDPAPDFQFKNDTGHYLLFQAEMDETTQNLRFTFWGTSDGRKGSYTPPTVIRWIGVGDPINTETLDLEPGEKKCQSAHVGADTTFTYSVVRPDGTVETTGYPSHYRPLPEICLVGVEELSTPDGLQPATDDVSSTEAAEAPVPSDTMPQPDAQTKTE
jgi:vancomycin resistance protein YoaR